MSLFLEGGKEGGREGGMLIKGKSVGARCAEPAAVECRLVLGYVYGNVGWEEAEEGLRGLSSSSSSSSSFVASVSFEKGKKRMMQTTMKEEEGEEEWLPLLLKAMKKAREMVLAAAPPSLPPSLAASATTATPPAAGPPSFPPSLTVPHYQLFLPDLLSQAIQTSSRKLDLALREGGREGGRAGPAGPVVPVVAWGNTNSKASDYKGALQGGGREGRRVVFLRWGEEIGREGGREGLLLRNVWRAAEEGKYVPARTILLTAGRCEALLGGREGGREGGLLRRVGMRLDLEGRPVPLGKEGGKEGGREGGGGGVWKWTEGRREGGREGVEVPLVAGAASFATSLWGGNEGGSEGGRGGQAAAVAAAERAVSGLAPVTSVDWGGGMEGGRGGRAAAGGAAALSLSREEWERFSSSSRRRGGEEGREEAAAVAAVATAAAGAAAAVGCAIEKTRVLMGKALREVRGGWREGGREEEVGVKSVWRTQGGEWRKMKGWSKKAEDMNEDWRRDYAKARNITMTEREEFMRNNNGTDPWLEGSTQRFDFELWQVLRTLTGNNNPRF